MVVVVVCFLLWALVYPLLPLHGTKGGSLLWRFLNFYSMFLAFLVFFFHAIFSSLSPFPVSHLLHSHSLSNPLFFLSFFLSFMNIHASFASFCQKYCSFFLLSLLIHLSCLLSVLVIGFIFNWMTSPPFFLIQDL